MTRRRRLSDEDVRAIRASTTTYAETGRQYQLSPSMIGQVTRRETYADVDSVPPPETRDWLDKGDLVQLRSGGPVMTVADTSLLGTVTVTYAADGVIRTTTLGVTTVRRVTHP